ncbi:MAG: hypothetical protein ACHRHE_08490 [Tepidisphaerales bacterium]
MRWCVLIVLATMAGCDNGPASRNETKRDEKQETPASANGQTKLPVSAVTLYASGVARLEHKGAVNGDAAMELTFKNGQVAGVLRSMIVEDGANALSTTIQPMDPPAATTQSARRVNLAENPTRAELLAQLRGTRVRLQVGDDMREVTIVSIEGVEPSDKPGKSEKAEKTEKSDKAEKSEKSEKTNGQGAGSTRQLNVLSGNSLQSIRLDDVRRIELSDPRAQEDVKRAVEALWQKDADRKTVSVRLRGKGERSVRVGYTIEAPPWKVSYRLVLSDKPSLQGWATLANDTDTDWNGVQLNLMGGRPFLLAQDATADAATSAATKAAKGTGVPAGESFRRPRPLPSRDSLDVPRRDAPAHDDAGRSPDGPVISARDGFRYTLADVTVPRQSTAVVPIMSDAITVEPVAVYNDAILRRNALQGARIRNTSKHYLLQGTATVLEDGNYAGDAGIENLAPGRYGLITWGIDLPVLVDATEFVHSTSIEAAAIDAGVLRLDRQHVYTRQYVMENEDQKDRSLIIEHPIRRGWRLVAPVEPMETTETVYRFRQALPAASRARLAVKEQITEADGVDLASADVETVGSLSRDVEIPAAVREALAKVAAMKQSGASADRQIQRMQAELDQLLAEQTKVRDQAMTGTGFGESRPRPPEKAEQLEKDIQRLREKTAEMTEKQDAARESLELAIRKVTVAKTMRPITIGEK